MARGVWGVVAVVGGPMLPKVMMVDDEPLMTDLIQAHLEEDGYANFVATNEPREALALLHREGLPAVCRALLNASEFLYY